MDKRAWGQWRRGGENRSSLVYQCSERRLGGCDGLIAESSSAAWQYGDSKRARWTRCGHCGVVNAVHVVFGAARAPCPPRHWPWAEKLAATTNSIASAIAPAIVPRHGFATYVPVSGRAAALAGWRCRRRALASTSQLCAPPGGAAGRCGSWYASPACQPAYLPSRLTVAQRPLHARPAPRRLSSKSPTFRPAAPPPPPASSPTPLPPALPPAHRRDPPSASLVPQRRHPQPAAPPLPVARWFAPPRSSA